MVATAVLLFLLSIATVTDVRWRKVFNWTVYPGIVVALVSSAIATWFGFDSLQGTDSQVRIWGIVPLADSAMGFLVCGSLMVFCYVLFAGALGGGDVKLIAMIGAFLGMMSGVEAMLWTFVLGGCQALITLVWRHGFWNVARQAVRFVKLVFRAGSGARLSEPERKPLKTDLFLSPSALVAVVIVRFGLAEWL